MRTTLDLPDNLLRKAKIAAVQRGTTLRELVSTALARELNHPQPVDRPPKHARFPIFVSAAPGALNLAEADSATLDAEEDTRRGFAG
jgi:hypothetical protein